MANPNLKIMDWNLPNARVDYSGLERGIGALGQGLAMGLERNRQEKEKEKAKKSALEFMKSQRDLLGIDKEILPDESLESGYDAGGIETAMSLFGTAKQMEEQKLAGKAAQLAYGDGSGEAYEGLSPEQQKRVFAEAMPMFMKYSTQRADIASKTAPKGDTPTAFQRDVEYLSQVFPELTVRQIATLKMEKQFQNPENGMIYRYDPATRTAEMVNPLDGSITAGADIPRDEASPEGASAELKDRYGESMNLAQYITGELTGISGSLKRRFNPVTTAIGEELGVDWATVEPELDRAYTNLKNMNRRLVMALQNSPRYAEGEREFIMSDVNIMPGWLKSPNRWKDQISAMTDYLKAELRIADKDAADPTLTPRMREAAKQDRKDIEFFLYHIGDMGMQGPDAARKYLE